MAKKTGNKKVVAASTNRGNSTKPRRIRPPKRRPWRRMDKRFRDRPALPSSFKITRAAAKLLWQNKKLFVGLALIYGILNIILVRGLAGSVDVTSLKHTLSQSFGGQFGQLASGFTVFAVLVGSAGNGTSGSAGAYQLFLALILSLAIIWALRQRLAGTAIRLRDSFYLGMYPLIPFILVLIVVGLQLLPLVIGASLYSLVVNGGIAVHAIEKVGWAIFCLFLAGLSLYWICSSVFALYIVTLPNMTPMKALRSARELVRYRRWSIIRKVLFLPLSMLIVAAIIVVPVIILVAPAAQWVVFALSMLAIVAAHAYMYSLYREML